MNISRNNPEFVSLMKELVKSIRAKNDIAINHNIELFQQEGIDIVYRREQDEIHCLVKNIPAIRFKAKEFDI